MAALIEASAEAAVRAARESVQAWIKSAEFVTRGNFLHFKNSGSFQEAMRELMIAAQAPGKTAAAFSRASWEVWSKWSSLYRLRLPRPGAFIPLILGSQRGLFTANSLASMIRRELGQPGLPADARAAITSYATWFFESHMDWLLTTVVSAGNIGQPLDGSGWGAEGR